MLVSLARVPARWTHLAETNSRKIRSLSMILFAKVASTFADQTLVLLAHLNELNSLRHHMCIGDCFVSHLGRVVDVMNGVLSFPCGLVSSLCSVTARLGPPA